MRIKVASAGVIPRHSPFLGTHVVFLSRGVNEPIFVRVDNFILHDSLLVNKTTKAMRKKIKDVFAKLRKIIKDNTDEKTICFIDRGSWSDPQIAIYGKLLNYWDVESLLPENCDEPTDEDWICAAQDSYFGYTECNVELDNFQDSDALNVIRIINIK